MLKITFTVPGIIQPKQRPRMGRGGHFYTPKATQDGERSIGIYAKLAMKGKQPIAGYCILCVRVEVEPTASWPEKKKLLALSGCMFPSRSDVDNQLKTVGDSCNGIVWNDDRQIVRIIGTQVYGLTSKAIVTVAEINNLDELEQITLDIL